MFGYPFDLLETLDGSFYRVRHFEHPPNGWFSVPKYVFGQPGDFADDKLMRWGVDRTEVRGFRSGVLVSLKGSSYLNTFWALEDTARQLWSFDNMWHRSIPLLPTESVAVRHSPRERLQEIIEAGPSNAIEQDLMFLVDTLSKSTGLPQRCMGITNSLLVGAWTKQSDLDVVVYGLKPAAELGRLWPDIHAEYFRGTSRQTDALGVVSAPDRFQLSGRMPSAEAELKWRSFSIFAVRESADVHTSYGDQALYPIGTGRISGEVISAEEGWVIPARYLISPIEIDEYPTHEVRDVLTSQPFVEVFGGWCLQAFKGQKVLVRGVVEWVTDSTGRSLRLNLLDWPMECYVRTR